MLQVWRNSGEYAARPICLLKTGRLLGKRVVHGCESGISPKPIKVGPPMRPIQPPPPRGKNVLHLIVDDLRTDLGAYGHKFIHSPNVDEFAEAAGTLVFDEAHVQAPMCVPTRNSFMVRTNPDLARACDCCNSDSCDCCDSFVAIVFLWFFMGRRAGVR